MQTYSEFQPTGFDTRGLNADQHGIGEFFVLPCMRTRDSDVLEESNFQSALDTLGGESETVQVHRFGHWGPGWYELILIDPNDAKAVAAAEDIEAALADYPILDEDDHSRREYELQLEGIQSECGRYVKDNAADDWPSRVFSWFWDNEQSCLDHEGFTATEDKIKRCLRALKLCERKYLHYPSILRRVTPIGRPSRDVFIRVRRLNPEYPF